MKNQISVKKVNEISIDINGQRLNLPYEDAKKLYDLLGKELNILNDLTFRYQGEPLYTKCTPVYYGTSPDYTIQPYTITCSTGETK